MNSLYPLMIVIHVFSAVIWVGGVLFMALVAVPAARSFDADQRRQLLDLLGRKFRPIGWVALFLLVLSGTYFMWRWGARPKNLVDLSFFSHGHTRLLGYKLLAVLAMLIISGLHDFWLGPKATRKNRTPEEIAADRRLASLLGRGTGLLVLIIVGLAIFIARPWV